MGDVKCMKRLTSEVFSNSRIGSNSTNKQKEKDEENEAPLQSGQLLPFLQREMESNGSYYPVPAECIFFNVNNDKNIQLKNIFRLPGI